MTRTRPLSLTVIAATSWAAATVLTKVALRELAPLDLLGIELFSSAIAMGSLLVARGRPLLPRNWPLFALLGVLDLVSASDSSTSASHARAQPMAPS